MTTTYKIEPLTVTEQSSNVLFEIKERKKRISIYHEGHTIEVKIKDIQLFIDMLRSHSTLSSSNPRIKHETTGLYVDSFVQRKNKDSIKFKITTTSSGIEIWGEEFTDHYSLMNRDYVNLLIKMLETYLFDLEDIDFGDVDLSAVVGLNKTFKLFENKEYISVIHISTNDSIVIDIQDKPLFVSMLKAHYYNNEDFITDPRIEMEDDDTVVKMYLDEDEDELTIEAKYVIRTDIDYITRNAKIWGKYSDENLYVPFCDVKLLLDLLETC